MTIGFPEFLRLFAATAAALVIGGLLWPSAQQASAETKRYPYEHVIRITATLEFDGERIDVDDLVDCRSKYEGPASRAAQLGFSASRWQFPYETRDGGMIMYSVLSNACGAYADIWAGVEEKIRFPDAWTPLIQWYDHRDPALAVRGEIYWSETALRNPSGRLRIVDQFRVLSPEQTSGIVEEAEQQVYDRRVKIGESNRISSGSFLEILPAYLKVPRDAWSQPPAYLRTPGRPSDVEGLREYLDGLPDGAGLMYIGEEINHIETPALMFSINDLMTGRWGSMTAMSYHGIAQENEPRWGMFLSERSWRQAIEYKERIPFFDDWIPLNFQNGAMILRTDTPGIVYMHGEHGTWQGEFNFLDKPFVNGPHNFQKELLIFDLETRDLWVRY